MTEAEAAEKWCPFARTGIRYGEAAIDGNRDPEGKPRPYCRCIASACMAWRWFPAVYEINQGKQYPPTEGYCGLAGTTSALGD